MLVMLQVCPRQLLTLIERDALHLLLVLRSCR